MRKRIIALLLAGPATALFVSACAPPVTVAHSNLTVQCTETLVSQASAVTTGGVVGTGHCTMTGVLRDNGPTIDFRTASPTTILIRRVISFTRGTITFVITIPLVGSGGERWTITSGTKIYTELHGRGVEVVDDWTGSPAVFVLKGTVSLAQA